MKKLALTIVAAMAMTGAALAQGYVTWSPASSTVTFETNTAASPLFGGSGSGGVSGLTSITAGGFDYALLYQSTPNGVLSSDVQVWDGTWTGAAGNTGTAMTGVNGTGLATHAGWVTANTVNGQSGSGVQVAWGNGVTNSIILVGWSTSLGSTWAGVSNILAAMSIGNYAPLTTQLAGAVGFFGETTIGNVNPATASPGTPIFATSSTPLANSDPIFSLNTPMYELVPVPEPATLALAGLGGLSMLLFRRRRQ
jgi:hypothetical protein